MRFLIILLFFYFINSNVFAKIDIKKRDLCKTQKYQSVCESIIGKTLRGHNTIANFYWDKGKIIGIVKVKRGENISLLKNPDQSYNAKYSGAHLVYKDAGGTSITTFKGDRTLKHLICDESSGCKKSTDYYKD
tara:strand:- start:117 stop:515 length:399 start_codon:yes stop_codon:yes gene_type:complete